MRCFTQLVVDVRRWESGGRRGEPPRNAIALDGPAGSGKLRVLHDISRALRAAGIGETVVTVYIGVAAIPFGGPTALALHNYNPAGPPERASFKFKKSLPLKT
jgi:hypothetical protein